MYPVITFVEVTNRNKEMSVSAAPLLLAASMAITLPALASEICSQLPDALQTIPVNHISQNSELSSLDSKLDFYLKPVVSQRFSEERELLRLKF
jgi:hypothetical protein